MLTKKLSDMVIVRVEISNPYSPPSDANMAVLSNYIKHTH